MVLTFTGAVTSDTVTGSISSTMSTWLVAISSKEIITAFWSWWYIFTISNLFKHDINYKRCLRAIFSKIFFFLRTSFRWAKLYYTQSNDTFTLVSAILAQQFFIYFYLFLITFSFFIPEDVFHTNMFFNKLFFKRRYYKKKKASLRFVIHMAINYPVNKQIFF